jgi:hypothetical protein
MLAAGMVGALVCGVAISLASPPINGPFADPGFTNQDLARALGDSGDLFVSPWITCRTRSGRVDHRRFNRRCLRRDVEGLCYPGTGETRTAIFVWIRQDRYHVVGTRSIGIYEPCAPVT